LKRGNPLRDSEITTERRDVLSLREPLDESALKNPSLELVESVQAGQPVLARSVRTKPVVLRGQFVDGLVRDGSLNIALKVEVLADGLPGQTVRVRNPKTKREFYAKVQDEQTVVINL
jgi:flagella basal body P-ring formation protein FlgA